MVLLAHVLPEMGRLPFAATRLIKRERLRGAKMASRTSAEILNKRLHFVQAVVLGGVLGRHFGNECKVEQRVCAEIYHVRNVDKKGVSRQPLCIFL